MQTLKTWAAEHIAVELGLLRECPYHGEPLRSQQPRPGHSRYCAFAAHDPLVVVFRGDIDEMIAAVENVAAQHGAACPLCERDEQAA